MQKILSVFSFGAVFLSTQFFSQAVFSQGPAPTALPSPSPLVPDQPPPAGINLTLSPTLINLTTDPGQPVSAQLKITNNNNFREFLRMDLAKFEAAEGGERPVLLDLTPEDEFTQWISFSEDQFAVDPNETKTIKFTISPPNTAALGYYYALIINRIVIQEPGRRQTVVAGAPAVLTLLEVRSPQAKRELQLVDFRPDQFFYEYPPVNFGVELKNSGNIHIVPNGDAFIDSMKNKDIAILPVNSKRGNVLPQTQRTFVFSWDDAFIVRVPKEEDGNVVKDAKGKTVYTTKWDLTKANKLRIGKYTAHLLLVYDNGERDIPLEAKVSFWVIPWKILAAVAAALFFAFVGVKTTISLNLRRLKGRLGS